MFGLPRSGKTFYAVTQATRWRGPVLVIDGKGDPALPWPMVDGSYSWRQIWRLAQNGGVHYVTQWNQTTARRELQAIASRLLDAADGRPVLVLADEAHEFEEQGKPAGGLVRLAKLGGFRNITVMATTQRPASLSKDFVLVCERYTFFRLGPELPWLKRYGMPVDEIGRRLDAGGKYAYVTVSNFGKVTGPHRVR